MRYIMFYCAVCGIEEGCDLKVRSTDENGPQAPTLCPYGGNTPKWFSGGVNTE